MTGRDSATWSGNGRCPPKPESLIRVPEIAPLTERWGRGGRAVELLLPDGRPATTLRCV